MRYCWMKYLPESCRLPQKLMHLLPLRTPRHGSRKLRRVAIKHGWPRCLRVSIQYVSGSEDGGGN